MSLEVVLYKSTFCLLVGHRRPGQRDGKFRLERQRTFGIAKRWQTEFPTWLCADGRFANESSGFSNGGGFAKLLGRVSPIWILLSRFRFL